MKIGLVLLLLLTFGSSPVGATDLKTRNVVLIMSDGLRWQEVFTGAEQALVSKQVGGVKDTNGLAREFWRDTAGQRREALMPFFWNVIARQGQLLGNQTKGSIFRVANGKNFSYPGYNEILTGIADPLVDSNAKKLNHNTNVFEWLAMDRRFAGKTALFGTWDVFPFIFNVSRGQLPIWPSWQEQFKNYEVSLPGHFNQVRRDTAPIFEEVMQDGFLVGPALHYFDTRKPRLLFVGFGDTDEWSHAGRYDLYLEAAHRADDFVRRLWELAQSKSQYRDKTTFIITADHGRGAGNEDWKHHGAKTAGSDGDWLAIIGPDTPPLGERQGTKAYEAGQIAATLAALLGSDFQSVSPRASPPIQELLER